MVSAATQDAIEEIQKWIDIFDSADSIDQERVFVYKVSHNRAAQLAQALSIIYNTQGATQTIDTSTGTIRTDTLSTVSSSNRNTAQNNNRNANTGSTLSSSTQTDLSSSLFDTPVRIFADGMLNRLVVRTTPAHLREHQGAARPARRGSGPGAAAGARGRGHADRVDEVRLEFAAKGSGSGLNSMLGTNYENLTPFGESKQEGFTFLLNDPNNPENKFGYIRALAGNNAIKVISSPQLLVASHTEARIQVGSRVPGHHRRHHGLLLRGTRDADL